MAAVSTPTFWDDLYARGGDGWDLRGTSTPLVDFMETTPPPPGQAYAGPARPGEVPPRSSQARPHAGPAESPTRPLPVGPAVPAAFQVHHPPGGRPPIEPPRGRQPAEPPGGRPRIGPTGTERPSGAQAGPPADRPPQERLPGDRPPEDRKSVV